MTHELASVPTSMFDSNGDIRMPSSKSDLKNRLQVELSGKCSNTPDALILDSVPSCGLSPGLKMES